LPLKVSWGGENPPINKTLRGLKRVVPLKGAIKLFIALYVRKILEKVGAFG